MPTLEIGALAEATGGALIQGDPHARVNSYVIDSRRAGAGSAFFAIKGTRTDGHRFVGEAAHNGAALVFIEHDLDAGQETPDAVIRVDDAIAALGLCGQYVRRHWDSVLWLAVTGSNGKTSTKELLAAGLSATRRVHKTLGNFNNHLGAPLSILAMPDDTEAAVLELGMSSAGEIASLAAMTDPDIGLVTNVRAAHLEFFDSLDGIAAAKGELFATLRDEATSVVNLDDMHVRVQATRHIGPRITYGQHASANVKLEALDSSFFPGTAFRFHFRDTVRTVRLKMGGAHAAFNALAALAAVVAAGEELDPAIELIRQVEPGPGRGKVHQLERGILLVDDSYNCSPAALASVLDTFKLAEPRGRKVLVLGDMQELGHLSEALHREAGKRAAVAGVGLLFAVGSLARGAAEVARRAGVPEVHHHADANKAAESVGEFLRSGDMVVVKGSRGMKLERVVQALLDRRQEA